MPLHGWVHDACSFYGNAVIIKKNRRCRILNGDWMNTQMTVVSE
jgi:hypothetical protein